MKEKLQRFMTGHGYHVDAFSRFLLGAALVLCVLNLFSRNVFLHSWTLLLIIYAYFRIFSKNYNRRYQENVKFLNLKNKVLAKFHIEKSHMEQRRTHHIYKCPTCRQKIRIPRGKGRICITCPKCKTEFTKTS